MKSGERKAESGKLKSEIWNGRLVDGGGLAAEPADATGVFETLLVHEGRAVFFDEHAKRFAAGCAWFGLAAAPSVDVLRASAAELVSRTALATGVLRWAAWKNEEGKEDWSMRIEPPRPHMLEAAWRVAVSPLRLPVLGSEAAFKHLGRQRWRDALAAGRAAGCDEVFLADSAGRIVEGAVSNVFCVRGGTLFTPSLGCGPLPGIERAKVLELAREQGAPVDEGSLTIEEVRAAEELFLTNSLVGIRPVAFLDGTRLPAPGPVTLRLQAAWRQRHGWG